MAAKVKENEIPSALRELFDRIQCNSGLIFVDTPEETRVIRAIFKEFVANDPKKGNTVQFWSLTQGLIEIPHDEDPGRLLLHDYSSKKARTDTTGQLQSRGNIINTYSIIEADCRTKIANQALNTKAIYVLRDADKFFNQPGPLRALRDLVYLASCSGSSIVITGFGVSVPNDLEKDSVYVRIPYPTTNEILNGVLPNVKARIEAFNDGRKDGDLVDASFDAQTIARACTGLTEDQVLNILGYSTTKHKRIDVDTILEEKKQIISKSDILEYWVCDTRLKDVGGFEQLKEWLQVQKVVMNHPEEAKKCHASLPKGIMILGVQGSGKTYIAKSAAADLGVGLIKLEMGKVFAGLVGESIHGSEIITLHTEDGIIHMPIEKAFVESPIAKVISYTRDGKAELKDVSRYIRHTRRQDVVLLTTKGGGRLKLTKDHSLFTRGPDGKLQEANPDQLKKGDPVARPKIPILHRWRATDVYWDTVENIETLEDQPEYVYDISVEDNENFIAGDIICHNSEKRMRQALAQADAAGGIILVDEIDKGLSGAGSSDRTDGGTTSRVIGSLLTWMSEPHPGVFIIATANDISALNANHPELLRKGRFDEIWFSDCPTFEERKDIFAIHLQMRGHDPKKFDLDALAKIEYEDEAGKTFTYTGAEIEYAVEDAIKWKFAESGGKGITIGGDNDIKTEDIIDKLQIIKPITYISRDKINSMRKWSAQNARLVSGGDKKGKKRKSAARELNLRMNIDPNDVSI